MKAFYSKLHSVIKKSSESEFLAFRKVIISILDDEMRIRRHWKEKNKGMVVKQTCVGRNYGVLPIPAHKTTYEKRIKYTQFVLDQKWDYLYENDKLNEEKKYYVYAHCDPRINKYDISKLLNIKGIPFYIGKGTGERHLDLTRNQGHGVKMREIVRSGHSINKIVQVIKDGLTEKEAFILESKLIYLFQTVYENQMDGILYNLDIGKRPDFIVHERIKVSPIIIRRNVENI